jgi:hypothetical protein
MSATEQIADAEVVAEEEVTGAELVHQPRRGEVLKPLDITQQKDAMRLYQEGLREILADSDWQDAGRGNRFVKKSGWRKIAAWFDLSIELLRDEVERDEDNQVSRACVWARALAPSGRFADGDGYCDVTETRFNRDSARQKLENDLRGTATTRAVNRAISNLVGMGAVSAEEVSDPQQPGLPYGPAYEATVHKATGQACVKLAGGEPAKGITLFKVIAREAGGYMPHIVALALIHAADTTNLVPDITAPDPT